MGPGMGLGWGPILSLGMRLSLSLMMGGHWGTVTADDTVPCGSPVQPRVVGGSEALPGQWPWQASVTFRGGHVCGGALIDPQWVLSAGHCFPVENPLSDYRISLGSIHLLSPPPHLQVRAVTSLHRPRDVTAGGGDLALLRLRPPVTPTRWVRPICLPGPQDPPVEAGTNCTVSGWGDTRDAVPLPPPKPLLHADVTVLSRRRCRCLYGRGEGLSPDMLCAGHPRGLTDACQGDSGGPLSCLRRGRWVLVGVVTSGVTCGAGPKPGLYTGTAPHRDWIRVTVGSAGGHGVPPAPLLV
ncbi:serine protease 33-like [Melopsittacus undulatus]|uniref:serine protease 33-like n=1 Tax=Melopsittacus undulatus TaxID=13146 RepID=UPI00146E8FD1|nr:serine protease 33-like [Melopsittacus undulatus]